jgi:hypothetical protein
VRPGRWRRCPRGRCPGSRCRRPEEAEGTGGPAVEAIRLLGLTGGGRRAQDRHIPAPPSYLLAPHPRGSERSSAKDHASARMLLSFGDEKASHKRKFAQLRSFSGGLYKEKGTTSGTWRTPRQRDFREMHAISNIVKDTAVPAEDACTQYRECEVRARRANGECETNPDLHRFFISVGSRPSREGLCDRKKSTKRTHSCRFGRILRDFGKPIDEMNPFLPEWQDGRVRTLSRGVWIHAEIRYFAPAIDAIIP